MKSLFRSLLLPALKRPRPRSTSAAVAATADLIQQAFDLGRTLRGPAPMPHAAERPDRAPSDRQAVGGSFQERVFTAAALSRRYKLYVPPAIAASPMLVVMLHGCTQDADDFATGTRMNAWAARDGFLVLYPIQPRTANPSGCWNWFRDQDQRRDQGEAAFIASLATTVAREHHVAAGAVFVAGLSAGAAMAAILAREYPDVFAAVGLHSGLAAGSAHNVPDAMRAMHSGWQATTGSPAATAGVAAIVFQGDADKTVHPLNADHLVAAFTPPGSGAPRVTKAGAGTRGSSTIRTWLGHDGEPAVESWTLHGAGHAWSGGDAAGSYTDPAGVDATAEMVRFFREHVRG